MSGQFFFQFMYVKHRVVDVAPKAPFKFPNLSRQGFGWRITDDEDVDIAQLVCPPFGKRTIGVSLL